MIDAEARDVIDAAGHGDASVTASATGSASRCTRRPGWRRPEAELGSATSSRSSRGLPAGQPGVRIEDLVVVTDAVGRNFSSGFRKTLEIVA